jgi:hypothetical protein
MQYNISLFNLVESKTQKAELAQYDLTGLVALMGKYKGPETYNKVHEAFAAMLVNDRVTVVEFPVDGGDFINVNALGTEGWNVASSLYACTDTLMYNRYAHADTKVGFHVKAWADRRMPEIPPYAAISVDHPRKGLFPVESTHLPWMQVARRARRDYPTFPKQDAQLDFVRKHDYVDYLIEGLGLRINFAVARNLAATVLMQVLASDLSISQEIRDTRLNAKSTMDKARKNGKGHPMSRNAINQGNGQDTPAPAPVANVGPIMVSIKGRKTKKDMNEVAPGRYYVWDGSLPLQPMNWDPSNEYSVKQFNTVSDEGFQVEL